MTETEPAAERPKQWITCGGCPARWTATNAAHCSGCHELFAGLALFDAHRSADGEHGACIPPGQVQGRDGEQRMFFRAGMWRGPELSEEQRERLRGLAS